VDVWVSGCADEWVSDWLDHLSSAKSAIRFGAETIKLKILQNIYIFETPTNIRETKIQNNHYRYLYSITEITGVMKLKLDAISMYIQCVPLAGSPGKCWFTKTNIFPGLHARGKHCTSTDMQQTPVYSSACFRIPDNEQHPNIQ
jgi:hypothetical protein